MSYTIPFCILLLFSLLDGAIAPFIMFSLFLVVGLFIHKGGDSRVYVVVSSVYLFFAFLISTQFENGQFFYLFDASHYIKDYGSLTGFRKDWDLYLMRAYTDLSDSDALYNLSLMFVSAIGNKYLDGTTVFYITLFQTGFGFLSILVFNKLLNRLYNEKIATSALLKFALLSLFLMYSCFIVRDIIIAFFYMLSLNILFKPFSTYKVFYLILFALITWGIRLYSGLFLLGFVGIYLYLHGLESTKHRTLYTLFFGILTASFVIPYILSSAAYEQTINDISLANEHSLEAEMASGGIITKLYRLPFGISQIMVGLYSQIAPFPPNGTLLRSENIVQIVIGLMVIVYEFFWYLVSYGLIITIVFKKATSFMSIKDVVLLSATVVFILANAAHPDIRRMMPMYPVIYICYLKAKTLYGPKWFKPLRQKMIYAYLLLFVVYLIIK